MSTPASVPGPRLRHQGPPLWLLALIYMGLFLIGLLPVTRLGGMPSFPAPWESARTFVTFFESRPFAVMMCAYFHFGAAIVLGIFTASIVNQMRFLGARAAGVNIALFGGLATAVNMLDCAFILWTLAHPGVAQDPALTSGLYYLSFMLGGPGFSVPFGLLMAGISITAGFMRLLPKWVVVLGIVLGVCGELSWFSLISMKAAFLIPLTRFPGFVWIIATGFLLPRTTTVARRTE